MLARGVSEKPHCCGLRSELHWVGGVERAHRGRLFFLKLDFAEDRKHSLVKDSWLMQGKLFYFFLMLFPFLSQGMLFLGLVGPSESGVLSWARPRLFLGPGVLGGGVSPCARCLSCSLFSLPLSSRPACWFVWCQSLSSYLNRCP